MLILYLLIFTLMLCYHQELLLIVSGCKFEKHIWYKGQCNLQVDKFQDIRNLCIFDIMLYCHHSQCFFFQYLHWQVWLGSVSIEVASLCLSCVDTVLRTGSLANLMGLSERISYVCSMVAALHAAASHLIKPRAFPRYWWFLAYQYRSLVCV